MRLKEVHIRWIGIAIIAVIAMFANPEHLEEKSWYYVYFISLCFTAVYWNGACAIIFFLRRKFPEISKTKRRLVFSSIGILIWMSVGGLPLKLLFQLSSFQDLLISSEHTRFLPFNFVAALVVSLSYEASYFFEKWKVTFRQNEELKNQQIRTQFEVLQNQMSPHFLFNSLNTLTTVISEDPVAAISFTEKLAEVYRYILQNKDRELVSLDEEIEFVKSYLFLLKMRYPDNLTFDFRIDSDLYRLSIPPLTLQMLVENAIKHNVVSKSKPLQIEIYAEKANSIIVKNNLQKKEPLSKPTQTGLENIRKRYEILGGREIDIITTVDNFMVAVPLIDLLEEKDLSLK